MGYLDRWRPPSLRGMRREVEDTANEYDMPREFHRDLARVFDDDRSPRSMSDDVDRLMDEHAAPPSMRRRVSRMFDREHGEQHGRTMRGAEMYIPQMDLAEEGNDLVLKMDLPGMREQDIDVRLDADNLLTIAGERREEETKRERGYEYIERAFGAFSRSIELPRGVDASRIETHFQNGVLEVRVPKGEATRSRRIPIAGGRTGGREEPRVLRGESRENNQHDGTNRRG
jgi:HSP20 family protein